MESQPRVVVTGMGIVAPNGIGLDAYWDSLIHCKSGVGPITLFDTSDIPVKIAGEVKDFNLRDYFGKDCKPQRLARQTQLGLVACKMAIENAGISEDFLQQLMPLSLVLGICSGAVDVTELAKEILMTRGAKRVRPHIVGSCQPHAIGAALVQMLNVRTTVTTISAACPSGLDAVASAARMIKDGRTDLVVVGAADSPLNVSTVASFCAAGIPSESSIYAADEISRPFDLNRTGVVLSEGAGFLVLERMDSALARGAEPVMEIVAGATVTDAPGTEGMDGLFHSMKQALNNSGLYASNVDYICANACSDISGDLAEVRLIKKLFGDQAFKIPVTSIRGVTGHPLAAAGIFQLIASALAFQSQKVIPTANLHNSDPDCDLDHVPLVCRRGKLDIIMANGHGMGGENSTIIAKRIL